MSKARDRSLVRQARESTSPPMLLVELAAEVGISPALMSMIEGGFVPKLPTMEKVARALKKAGPWELWPDEYEEMPK